MALTRALVEAHIQQWEAALKRPFHPYREKWPSRLFHHAPIENAVSILSEGLLRSRADPENARVRDVAAAGVIDARNHAYDFARLYFRPRTPTQWNIEGIRRPEECRYGEHSHAPVLVMFVFDARSLLALPGIRFCDRNMQLSSAAPSDAEEYFRAIPFEKVYHEGGIGGDNSIIQHRCAEVLAPSPLVLVNSLQWVFCRSNAEKQFLIYLLGASAQKWKEKFVVSEDLMVFNKEYCFVEEVSLAENGLRFSFNPRIDRKNISVKITLKKSTGELVIDYLNNSMPATPDYPAKRWMIKTKIGYGSYVCEIELDGHLAFKAGLSLEFDLF